MANLAMSEFLTLLNSGNPGLDPIISAENCIISSPSNSVPGGIDRNTAVIITGRGYPYKNLVEVYYNRFDYSRLGVTNYPYENAFTKAEFLNKVSELTQNNFKEEYLEPFTLPTTMDSDFDITLIAKGDNIETATDENYFCKGSVTIRCLYRPNISQAFTGLKFNGL